MLANFPVFHCLLARARLQDDAPGAAAGDDSGNDFTGGITAIKRIAARCLGADPLTSPLDGFCVDVGMQAQRAANRVSDAKGAFTKAIGKQPSSGVHAIVASCRPAYLALDATLSLVSVLHSKHASKLFTDNHVHILFIECVRYRIACTQQALQQLPADDTETREKLTADLARFPSLDALHLPTELELVDAVYHLCKRYVDDTLVPLAFGGVTTFLANLDFGVSLPKRATHVKRHALSALDKLGKLLHDSANTGGVPGTKLLAYCSFVPRIATAATMLLTCMCSRRLLATRIAEGDDSVSVAPCGFGWDGDCLMLMRPGSTLFTGLNRLHQATFVCAASALAFRDFDLVDVCAAVVAVSCCLLSVVDTGCRSPSLHLCFPPQRCLVYCCAGFEYSVQKLHGLNVGEVIALIRRCRIAHSGPDSESTGKWERLALVDRLHLVVKAAAKPPAAEDTEQVNKQTELILCSLVLRLANPVVVPRDHAPAGDMPPWRLSFLGLHLLGGVAGMWTGCLVPYAATCRRLTITRAVCVCVCVCGCVCVSRAGVSRRRKGVYCVPVQQAQPCLVRACGASPVP